MGGGLCPILWMLGRSVRRSQRRYIFSPPHYYSGVSQKLWWQDLPMRWNWVLHGRVVSVHRGWCTAVGSWHCNFPPQLVGSAPFLGLFPAELFSRSSSSHNIVRCFQLHHNQPFFWFNPPQYHHRKFRPWNTCRVYWFSNPCTAPRCNAELCQPRFQCLSSVHHRQELQTIW